MTTEGVAQHSLDWSTAVLTYFRGELRKKVGGNRVVLIAGQKRMTATANQLHAGAQMGPPYPILEYLARRSKAWKSMIHL